MPDPLEAVWEPVLLPILERDPAVQAVTVLRHLQMTDPDAFPDDRVRRTLERRVRDWRALHGPERDVIFRQTPEPGRMALSDFTDARELGGTVAGHPLQHRLFHFVLAYSGWEHATVVLGGESFTALAENLQNALWTLGGVTHEHRTDSLSAAYRNLDTDAAADVTKRYEAFCAHYGMIASRNNPGEAHENGAVEAHNNHLKTALDQALILRGSRYFTEIAAWCRFVDELVARRNRRREAAALSAALPRKDACRRMVDLLWLTHDEGCEAGLAALIAKTLAQGNLPEACTLKQRLVPRRRALPEDPPVQLTDLASFDALLGGRA